jgi:hypothetical protein
MTKTILVAMEKVRDGVLIAEKSDDKARRILALQAAQRASLELANHIHDELQRLQGV